MARAAFAAICLALGACSTSTSPLLDPPDTGARRDAERADATRDASERDAAPFDAAPFDGAVADADALDADPFDADPFDADPPDAGFPDATFPDAELKLECPPPSTTHVDEWVTLTTTVTTAGAPVAGYEWLIAGSPNEASWNPDPPVAAIEQFRPARIGTYDIHASVRDAAGATSSCTTSVESQPYDLWIELTWNGGGDLDLHLHNGNTSSPWFTSDDCYYAQRTPLWDPSQPAGAGHNPWMMLDASAGLGPEIIRVDRVSLGEAYTIGVHHYSGGVGRIATVQIFCAGSTAPATSLVSPPLQGSGSGSCSNNDFWRVATVSLTAPGQCTIAPINTIGSAVGACVAF